MPDVHTPSVVQYLLSRAGLGTTPAIAATLLALGPGALGMSCPPSQLQLHNTRLCLEDLDRLAMIERLCHQMQTAQL